MHPSLPLKYRFETGIYRPPSEGGSDSLLVRFTRNCPWNRCTFCGMYKGERFEVRPVGEIRRDIDAIAEFCRDMGGDPERNGSGVDRARILERIRQVPEFEYHPGLAMVLQWLLSGAKTAFLQDADSLIMKTERLAEALVHLRGTFPSIERVTSYVRSRTLARKSPKELETLHGAGLDRVHVGLETGDDELLGRIRKGVTADGHVSGGKKALDAGFQLSEYWMPGLGGSRFSIRHAENTARVLNRINPHYIRSRPFRPWPGTPLYGQVAAGEHPLASPREQLLEIRHMIRALDVTSRVCFDHAGNHWKDRRGAYLFSHSYEGYRFPQEKKPLLERIEEGLSVFPEGS